MTDESDQVQDLYKKFRASSMEIQHLRDANNLLEWDIETAMPKGGAAARSKVVAAIEGLVHQASTTPEFGRLLERLCQAADAGELTGPDAAAVRLALRKFVRNSRLPGEFVRRKKEETAAAHHIWSDAREAKDFSMFRPSLEKLVAIAREEAAYISSGGSPYDVLLDEYEPGSTVATVAPMLETLRDGLVPLLRRINASPVRIDREACRIAMPIAEQQFLCRLVARKMGFAFSRGRMATIAHPMCGRTHLGDVHISTRYDETDLLYGLSSLIHEAGHGLYEQNLPEALYGTEAGEAPGIAIHESQSRLWENMVGKSEAFCEWLLSLVRDADELSPEKTREFYRAMNVVRPSFIRTEADELTYNLHIVLRFEIERLLVEGDLEAADVPKVWNDLSHDYLGIVPTNDAEGPLQDVHWSAGYFGYFPTYPGGNIMGAQIWDAAVRAMPGLQEMIRRGEFLPLKDWLTANIYSRGAELDAAALVTKVTGAPPDPSHFLRYLERKFGAIYEL